MRHLRAKSLKVAMNPLRTVRVRAISRARKRANRSITRVAIKRSRAQGSLRLTRSMLRREQGRLKLWHNRSSIMELHTRKAETSALIL